MPASPVLFLTYWYPSKNNKGFGIFIKRHAHAVKRSREVTMLALKIERGPVLFRKSVSRYTDEAGMDTHEIVIETLFNKLFFVALPLQYWLLRQYLFRSGIKCSLLVSNVIFPCGIVGHFLSKKSGCRHALIEHWTKVDKFFRKSLYARTGKRVYSQANPLIAVSQQLATTIRKYADADTRVIPNVVDHSEFFYDPTEKKYPVFTFIAVASWSQFKDPFLFLEALKELALEKQIGEFRVTMVGDGEQLDRVRQNNYPFEIAFTGSLPASRIREEMNRSHVFVHGSRFETFSVVIAEALCCGLPCVVSPVGIATEIIHGTNGFVAANDVANWKEKLIAVYRNSYEHAAIAEEVKNRFGSANVAELFQQNL